MKYVDYTFYKDNYHGIMPSTIFDRLVIGASAYIKRNTFGRIDETITIPDAVKYCACTLVDKMLKIEKREGKISEKVGTWSIDYVESKEDEAAKYQILLDYLDSKLLYRGC